MVPIGAAFLGLVSVFVAGQRMRRRDIPGEVHAKAPRPSKTGEDARRLERALAELDP